MIQIILRYWINLRFPRIGLGKKHYSEGNSQQYDDKYLSTPEKNHGFLIIAFL